MKKLGNSLGYSCFYFFKKHYGQNRKASYNTNKYGGRKHPTKHNQPKIRFTQGFAQYSKHRLQGVEKIQEQN